MSMSICICDHILFVLIYEGASDSGLTSVDGSGWCVRKIAEASEIGMMQSALD